MFQTNPLLSHHAISGFTTWLTWHDCPVNISHLMLNWSGRQHIFVVVPLLFRLNDEANTHSHTIHQQLPKSIRLLTRKIEFHSFPNRKKTHNSKWNAIYTEFSMFGSSFFFFVRPYFLLRTWSHCVCIEQYWSIFGAFI